LDKLSDANIERFTLKLENRVIAWLFILLALGLITQGAIAISSKDLQVCERAKRYFIMALLCLVLWGVLSLIVSFFK
jgi:hypothetical protein